MEIEAIKSSNSWAWLFVNAGMIAVIVVSIILWLKM
jgi:hypothetical protein